MAEESSGLVVAPVVPTRPCRFCDQPVPQRAGRVREFCGNTCRAAYRDRERDHAIRAALGIVEDTQGVLEGQCAALEGARRQLQRFLKGAK
jgi:hypothetical protein